MSRTCVIKIFTSNNVTCKENYNNEKNALSDADQSGDVMIDLRKFFKQIISAKVVVEKLSITSIKVFYNVSLPSNNTGCTNHKVNPRNKQDPKLVKLNCIICKNSIANRKPYSLLKTCARCKATLKFQCKLCKAIRNSYSAISYHINTKCNKK